ncbi:MAG TPA: pyruvate, phosphate dikinase [Caldithrix abyssi]|uniref:Phosphoenolpyruvate synthase n=1 Tax=Caldithrix abyssi TaxID=187145 RepID=A0A7V5LIV9_CALAY|nr:pyruvate, phosphate dikinase [Caldithrix abyssi]
MNKDKRMQSIDKLIDTLEERVKELNVLYEVEEILHQDELTLDEIFKRIVNLLPTAFQFPEICRVKIHYHNKEFMTDDYKDSPYAINADLIFQDRPVGWIRVCYIEKKPPSDVGPFLLDEKHLVDVLAQRLSFHIMYIKLKKIFDKWETAKKGISGHRSEEWEVILELLKRTDPDLYLRIARKMLNLLVWKGVSEANKMLQQFNPYATVEKEIELVGEVNEPLKKEDIADINRRAQEIFVLASQYLPHSEILSKIQQWIQEDKTSFLVRATSDNNSSLTDISEALRRYYQINPEGMALSPSSLIGVRAALIRRFFTDQLEFINIAKHFVRVRDFYKLLKRMIFPIGSHGKLGGKSAGLFLAYRILKSMDDPKKLLENIKTPKTWHITSDAMIYFMHYNNLDELLEHKYKPISDVRNEYPHVIQLFKNSHFPPEIVKGVAMALDDFGERPLIVRSSSLLEDRLGSAFLGKYKSLFIANQGSKADRLEALLDAIAEVYASTIGPDPIEYRAERGLLDFHEEMGIMIQEVVGKRVGDYFLPAFAGVAFSNNEFRWSPRIKREDGLLRLVPGLGTRAVDRLSDDYPVLIAPGQPNLRAKVSVEEIVHYSPRKADVINLKTRQFETIEIEKLLKEYGYEYPMLEKIASVYDHGMIRDIGFNTNLEEVDLAITFNGLLQHSNFVAQTKEILKILQNRLATPVDIEFAHDGENFYLLQCRPQSYSSFSAPAKFPQHIPDNNIIFTANKYITNGIVSNIKYIVYVDLNAYSEITDINELKAIGRAVGELNKILPKRQFILMGPGRWGSRGDIKLGVSVTYSDINNTAVLIEIARRKGNYVPDLSFGTHFFQDLVEANIKYLPLYPDNEGIIFKEDFFLKSTNSLNELLPSFANLDKVLHVIDVPAESNGLLFHILMNGEQEKAMGLIAPSEMIIELQTKEESKFLGQSAAEHWQWRQQMADRIAEQLDAERFGVKGLYLLGSTRSGMAQAGSDIDLLVHFVGTPEQRRELDNWFEGWSLALDEINYQRTGYKAGGLLDIHYITDEEIIDEKDIAEKIKYLGRDGFKKLILSNETA